jgi:hypothetical protein
MPEVESREAESQKSFEQDIQDEEMIEPTLFYPE